MVLRCVCSGLECGEGGGTHKHTSSLHCGALGRAGEGFETSSVVSVLLPHRSLLTMASPKKCCFLLYVCVGGWSAGVSCVCGDTPLTHAGCSAGGAFFFLFLVFGATLTLQQSSEDSVTSVFRGFL